MEDLGTQINKIIAASTDSQEQEGGVAALLYPLYHFLLLPLSSCSGLALASVHCARSSQRNWGWVRGSGGTESSEGAGGGQGCLRAWGGVVLAVPWQQSFLKARCD